VLRAAYRSAGVAPGAVQYIEAHGTGTPLSDRVEIEALAAVLGPERPADRPCLLGSVKTNIGHTEAAAGVAGVIKVALALRHRRLPPNLHFKTPAAALAGAPLRVVEELSDWPGGADRVAGVSSFGIGGTNAHVVLAEAPEPAAAARPSPDIYLLPLSAHSAPALAALAQATSALLAGDVSPAGLCASAAASRSHPDQRVAVVGPDAPALADQLRAVAAGEQPPGVARGAVRAGGPGPLVWVFSGQGSGWAEMGRVLLAGETAARAALLACEQALAPLVDWPLLEVLAAPGAEGRLAQPAVGQPALAAVQIALAAQWRAWGVRPDAVVGQSTGEIAAAYAAGALSLEDAMRIAAERGRLVQTVAGQGAAALVGLPAERAQLVLTGFEDVLSIAGQISPSSTVLTGDPAMLDRVLGLLGRRNIFCRRLAVAGAAHSAQMEPLQPLLQAALAGIAPRPTDIPLYSTVTAAPIDGPALGPAYWSRNLREPFRVSETLQQLIGQGASALLEVSPHPILARACREHQESAARAGLVLPSLRRGDTDRRTLLASLAQLYVQGHQLAWEQVAPRAGQPVRLPTYPWQRERYWLDQLVSA
jgi:acyl transferase domain-containing protein